MARVITVLKVGDRVFNRGDIANLPCTGTVEEIRISQWGTSYEIVWDVEEGGKRTTSRISETSFVSNSPYNRFRKAGEGEMRKLPAKPFEPDLSNVY